MNVNNDVEILPIKGLDSPSRQQNVDINSKIHVPPLEIMAKPVILSVNAGSSSIKYSIYEKTSANTVQLIANASISGLTAPPSQFSYTLYDPSSSKETESSKAAEVNVSNHAEAFKYFTDFLTSGTGRKTQKPVLDLKQVSVVCHRIVHGGPEPKPLIITQDELHHLDALSDLAPLYVLNDIDELTSDITMLHC
jgi:acetate kinase